MKEDTILHYTLDNKKLKIQFLEPEHSVIVSIKENQQHYVKRFSADEFFNILEIYVKPLMP